MLTREEEKYYEEARMMFSTPGWKNLMQEIQDNIDDCTIDKCKTLEELWFQKGRLAVLRVLMSYEETARLSEQEAEYGVSIN